jgi:hypothetical protein
MDEAGQGLLPSTPAQAGSRNDAVLYVLACPLPERNGDPAYLIHQVGGVGCVMAYSDLGQLVECCGEYQPWLAIRLDALMADLRDQQLPGPVVNLPLSPDVRWGPDGPPWNLTALATAVDGGLQRTAGGGA